jgi:hypothetical protein
MRARLPLAVRGPFFAAAVAACAAFTHYTEGSSLFTMTGMGIVVSEDR